MTLQVFSNPICNAAVNQALFPSHTAQQRSPLAGMIEENRRRSENFAYGIGVFLRKFFSKEQLSPVAEHPRAPSTLNPQTWPLPEVHASQKTTQSIQKLVKERGIAYQPFTLDTGQRQDPCLSQPNRGLLSQSDLRGVDRSKPVVLLAHGFSASSYEWEDLARYIDQHAKGAVRYSKIVLGGHGRSLEAFKNSDWQDWGKPILEEYRALAAKGFTNISLAGSSTACALILEQLDRGCYSKRVKPKNVFFIDPIVEPNSLLIRLFVRFKAASEDSYPPTQAFSPEEFSRWHGKRPFAALKSLDDLTQKVQRALTNGIQLPSGTHLSVWASQGDPTVNPNGYKLIQKGARPGAGGSVSVYPVDSKFHVFTRLSGRPQATKGDHAHFSGKKALTRGGAGVCQTAPIPFTLRDRQIQKGAFDAMLSRCG